MTNIKYFVASILIINALSICACASQPRENNQHPFDFNSAVTQYKNTILSLVVKQQRAPDNVRLNTNLSAQLQLYISDAGAIEKLVLSHSSGDSRIDAAAMDAVRAAAPFPAVPKQSPHGFMIQLMFPASAPAALVADDLEAMHSTYENNQARFFRDFAGRHFQDRLTLRSVTENPMERGSFVVSFGTFFHGLQCAVEDKSTINMVTDLNKGDSVSVSGTVTDHTFGDVILNPCKLSSIQ